MYFSVIIVSMKISKSLFITLCAMLFIAIILIAFLVGRQSAPQKQFAEVNPRAASSGPTSSPENIPVTTPQGSDIYKNQASGNDNLPKAANTNNPGGAQSTDNSEKEKVKAYFQQMDSIGTLEEISGNSQELAAQIVQNALNENYSEIDEMIQKCRRIKTSVEAITPPQSCVEFHTQVLKSIDEASTMYADFKSFFQRKDESILKSISEKSTALNSKMTGLENMQKNIKLKYGI